MLCKLPSSQQQFFKLVRKDSKKIEGKEPIFLLAQLKNERILLPYFFKYYDALGITDFIIVDNCSTDGSYEYLLSAKYNIKLYRTNENYAKNEKTRVWTNKLLLRHCKNKYCLVVDIDEIFMFKEQFDMKNPKRTNPSYLERVIKYMKTNDINYIKTLMVDMYPEEINNSYREGMPFIEHSQYYDKYNDNYNILTGKYTDLEILGGARLRLYGTNGWIMKTPVFKFDFFRDYLINAGCHQFRKINKYSKRGTIRTDGQYYPLFHFKYIKHDIKKVWENHIKNKVHYNNSVHYKEYCDNFKNKLTDPLLSVGFKNLEKLKIDLLNSIAENTKKTIR